MFNHKTLSCIVRYLRHFCVSCRLLLCGFMWIFFLKVLKAHARSDVTHCSFAHVVKRLNDSIFNDSNFASAKLVLRLFSPSLERADKALTATLSSLSIFRSLLFYCLPLDSCSNDKWTNKHYCFYLNSEELKPVKTCSSSTSNQCQPFNNTHLDLIFLRSTFQDTAFHD